MDIFGMLNDIVAIVGEFFEFLLHEISTFASIVLNAALFVGKFPLYFSFLPSAVSSVLIVGLTVAVVYKIVGREG